MPDDTMSNRTVTNTLTRSLLTLALAGAASGTAWAQLTPPISPKTRETPLPPAVTLPAPAEIPEELRERSLTAADAARIALRQHNTVAAARASITQLEGRTRQARASLKPTLSVGAGYTRSDQFLSGSSRSSGPSGSVSTSTGMQASVSLRQLLFDRNHSRDLVRQAEAQEDAAERTLARTEADLVLQVKQAFYTYVQNMRLVQIHETNLRNQQQHLAQAQARLQAGVGLPLDVVRAEAAVSEATLNLQVARNNASTARVSLALLMGIDPRTPIEVAESEEPAPPTEDLESLVQLAIAQRPELGQAEATRAAAIHALDAARSTDAPTVAATAGVAARGVSTPPLNHFLSVGIQVQWSPFDGGVKDGRVQEAQASIQAAEAQLEGTRRTIIADVSQAYLNLRTAEQRVVTADAGIANAEEALRLATGRYNAGLGTFLDVLDAQAALLTARTQRVNAEMAVAQARAALARAVGTPLDEE